MRLNKHLIIHSVIIIVVCTAIVVFGVLFKAWNYIGTFIFGGTVVSTIYEMGSRGHKFSKRKFTLNIVILITSLTLFISTISAPTIGGLNMTPFFGGKQVELQELAPTFPDPTFPEPGPPEAGDPQITITKIEIIRNSKSVDTLDKGEIGEIIIYVSNKGDGTAKTILVYLDVNKAKLESNAMLAPYDSTMRSIRDLPSGDTQTVKWGIEAITNYETSTTIRVRVSTSNAGAVVATKLIELNPDSGESGDNGDNGDNDEPEYIEYDNEAQNMFAVMFTEVLSNTMTGITLTFIVLGTILIIMGDAQDSKDMYAIGSFAAAVPSALTIFSLFFGWAEPSAYFIDMAGASMAGFAQGIVTLVVLMLLLSVAFMFDDLIGSALE